MAINTSINKLRDTQNSLDSIKNSISSSISNKMSLVFTGSPPYRKL